MIRILRSKNLSRKIFTIELNLKVKKDFQKFPEKLQIILNLKLVRNFHFGDLDSFDGHLRTKLLLLSSSMGFISKFLSLF